MNQPNEDAMQSNSADGLKAELEMKYGPGEFVITELRGQPGVAIVLPMDEHRHSNALLKWFTSESEKYLDPPQDLRGGLGFSDVYYVNGELTFIYIYGGRDFACVVDELTGQILRSYESR